MFLFKPIFPFRLQIMSKKSKGKRTANGCTDGPSKREKSTVQYNLSGRLDQPELKQRLSSAWKSESCEDTLLDGVTLIKDPFNCCVIKNVIEDSSSLPSSTDGCGQSAAIQLIAQYPDGSLRTRYKGTAMNINVFTRKTAQLKKHMKEGAI